MKHPQYLPFALLFCLLYVLSCGQAPAPEPLQAARQKLAAARSIQYQISNTWNNTFVQDTMVEPARTGTYLRNEREGFAYDFVFESDNAVSIYRNGALEDIDLTKRRRTTYTAEEAAANLAYVGSYTTGMTPMVMIKDSAWARSGTEGKFAVYEKVINDEHGEEGHAYTVERMRIDSLRSELAYVERIYTLDGEARQHLIHHFHDYAFDQHDSLFYLYPEGLTSIANADLEKQQRSEQVAPGSPFPAFDLVDVEGNAYSSESVKGKKQVFVFSFIGCGGCEYARKELAKSNFSFSDEYVGFYVNPINSSEQIVRYHENKPWPFRMAAIDDEFSDRYGVYAYPTFITVDENGIVEEFVEGYDEAYFADKAAR